MKDEIKEFAKIGYDAYSEQTGGVSAVTGDKLPAFEDTPNPVQLAWYAAAQAIDLEIWRRISQSGASDD